MRRFLLVLATGLVCAMGANAQGPRVEPPGAALPAPPSAGKPFHRMLEAIGRWVANAYGNILIFLDFLGRTLLSLMESLFNPRHWRITSIIFSRGRSAVLPGA